MRIAVTGLLGQYAFGGVTWDYIQYLLGFRSLGHDVWYLEDSGAWPYDPIKKTVSEDCSYNVNYLRSMMESFGFGNRWIYRNGADSKFHGAGETAARDLIKNGDLLINVSSAGWLRDYEFGVKHQMFIDGDPLFCQVGLLNPKNADYAQRVRAHDSHFSFGLNVGHAGCLAPDTGIRWKKTVQPVALDYWPFQEDDAPDRFTTVMNWASYLPVEWRGRTYGQKDVEFERFKFLPQHTPQRLEMAMGQGVGSKRPTEELRALGWVILEAGDVLPDHQSYHEFLRASKAEWSVAKNGYVAGRTGWFSCRTACYLALGRPAVVQETGWSDYIPAGDGLLAFSTLEEAAAAISDINDHYAEHRAAARAIAEQFFDAKKVCADLLTQAGIG
ncbi:MAG TPA: hypothetical protein VL981_12950 [Candidatus Methylacidiphilales bacterium]|nr:hypothetical protein [Candidatus Methylacidiphilales bacterium]